MHLQRKTLLGGLVITTLLIIFLTGCKETEDFSSPYVQDIVPAQQNPAFWYLSPAGNKLLYDIMSNQDQAIVRFLTTGQEIIIGDCSRFRWLDNERVYCHDYRYFSS